VLAFPVHSALLWPVKNLCTPCIGAPVAPCHPPALKGICTLILCQQKHPGRKKRKFGNLVVNKWDTHHLYAHTHCLFHKTLINFC
jgi:hypothetical protein